MFVGAEPAIWLSPADELPTAVEEANDLLIKNRVAGVNTITWNATAVPSADVTYKVKGV
jgi:hypothetical protein